MPTDNHLHFTAVNGVAIQGDQNAGDHAHYVETFYATHPWANGPQVPPMPEQPSYNDHIEKLKRRMKLTDIDMDKTKIQDVFGNATPPIAPITTLHQYFSAQPDLRFKYEFKDDKSLVGIEVEVENVLYINPNIQLLLWSVHNDGSLRNNGREFKTLALPLKYIPGALEILFRGLNKDVDWSHRTSVHVHLDARGMTVSQLYGLLVTYAVVENILFKFASQDRRKSIFCVPITETSGLMHNHLHAISFLHSISQMWHKYTALNLLTLQSFGTVEFRQMPGTNDLKKIAIWCDLLSRLKVFAYKHPLKYILAKIEELNTNSQYQKFVESIFEDLTPYLDLSVAAKDMENPVYVVKNCNLVNDFNTKVNQTASETSMLAKRFTLFKGLPSQNRCLLMVYKAHKNMISPAKTKEQLLSNIYNFVVENKNGLLETGLKAHVLHILDPVSYKCPPMTEENGAPF